jgi:hypothetical protein
MMATAAAAAQDRLDAAMHLIATVVEVVEFAVILIGALLASAQFLRRKKSRKGEIGASCRTTGAVSWMQQPEARSYSASRIAAWITRSAPRSSGPV